MTADNTADEITVTSDAEQQLTTLLGESWRETVMAASIAAGVKAKADEIRRDVAKGRLKNTARTRGYLEALLDLHRTLTAITNQQAQDTP